MDAPPSTSPRLALFDLDGTLLAGDTDVLWCAFLVDEGILDRETFGAANRDVADRYARGAISADEFAGFYAATLAGRSPSAWAPLRDRFVRVAIEPRIGGAARALVARHRDAGERLVLERKNVEITSLVTMAAALLVVAALGLSLLWSSRNLR